MKTKILSLFAALFFSVFSSNAQLLDEIRAYVDSSEVVFNNGRRMLYQSISDSDVIRSEKLFILLKEEAAKKHCSAFSYNEELYINLLLKDWKSWLANAENYKNRIALAGCYSFQDNYVERLYNLTIKNIEDIENSLVDIDLQTDERELIQLYLYLIKNNPDEIYSVRYKNLKKNHSKTLYSEFIKGYMPRPVTKGAFAFSIGPTLMIPSGKLADNFNTGVLFNYTMDFNIGKVYSGFHFDAGSLELTQAINFVDGGNNVVHTFTPGDKFSIVGGGLYGGYFLVRNKRFQLAPYVKIGGYTLESTLYNDVDDPEYEILNSFVYGPGLHTEIKLTEFTLDPYYGTLPGMESNSYLSLKLDIGYDIVTQKINPDFKGNLPYLRVGLVWGIGNF